MGGYDLCGGVGDLRLNFCFWLRCRDLRPRIDPAHVLTRFCFLLGFREMEERRELVGSIDGRGSSAAGSSGSLWNVSAGNLPSFPADPALVGGDLGEHSPEFVS
jgi:hypothetical protein